MKKIGYYGYDTYVYVCTTENDCRNICVTRNAVIRFDVFEVKV